MDIMDSGDGTDNVNKRAVAVFVVAVLVVLALAVWGGTFLGKSEAASRNQELSTNLASAQGQLSQLQSQYSSLQDSDAALRAQVASAQQGITTLQTQLASAQQDNAALQAQVASAQQGIATLQTQLASAQQNNAALQTQVASAQQGIATLQTQVASAQQNNAALQTQLTSAQQNIAALQAQLAAWYAWSHNAPPSPGLTLSSPSGPIGTSLTVTGSGLAANTNGNVVFDINRNGTSDTGEPSQNVVTSSTGTFSTALVVPSVPPGTYPVLAAFPIGAPAQASAAFSVG